MVMIISGASSCLSLIQGRAMLKNKCLFLVICANVPYKTDKFELEAVGLGTLVIGFCF